MYADNIIRVFEPLWKHLYKRFSGKHKKPGQKDFMMQDEFDEFVVQSGWLNDGLAAREIPLIFNLSMLVRVDELNKS